MSLSGIPDYGALRESGASPLALPDPDISVPGHHTTGKDYERWLEAYNGTGPENASPAWISDFPFPFSVFSDHEALHDSRPLDDRSVDGDLQSKPMQEGQATDLLRSLDTLPSLDLTLISSVSNPLNEQAQSSAATTPLPTTRETVRRRYGPEKWETIRDTLHQIYILQGNTLSQTMKILEQKHGFIASYG